MPELPEVETIRLSLEPHLTGQVIKKIQVLEKRLRWPVQVADLRKWIEGRKVRALERRAKFLIFLMENDSAMILHLGMSGRLGWHTSEKLMEPHTHVIFHLSGRQLRYRDPRRFGSLDVVPPGQLAECARLQNLGVEPLSEKFTTQILSTYACSSRRCIKNILIDARVVVGLGNIYANEALFFAGIDPGKAGSALSEAEFTRLHRAIRQVLKRALEKGGTTLNDYRNAHGEPGFFQMELAVYGRAGEPCRKCGLPIHKVVITGRSTFFCPACQR